MPSQIQAQAQKFVDACKAEGFAILVKTSTILTVEKFFTPGDREAFARCDMAGPSLLDLAPLRGGSVWGTDGGSIGGAVALQKGRYVLNKSGSTGARFVAEVEKLLRSK